MGEKTISQEFRLKNIKEIKNFITEHFLTSVSEITGSVSDFASLLGTPIGVTSSAIGSKICAITARTKKYR